MIPAEYLTKVFISNLHTDHWGDLDSLWATFGKTMSTIKPRLERVTDGIDQTNLLFLGEGNSNRNYMFHYGGSVLGACRYEDFKVQVKAAHGGLPGMEFYNIKRDSGEKYQELYPGLFAVTPVQMLLRQHIGMAQKFRHRPPEEPGAGELTPHD